jgi:A/G-specific adenine glycosylase
MTVPEFQKHILSWYTTHRRNLPWRNTRDPYKILVSEVMLQQTQVTRVIPKYEEFLMAFPTLEKLANAPDKKLLKIWRGLGYWKRALNLKKSAQIIIARTTSSQTSSRRAAGMVPLKADSGPRVQNPKSRRDFEARSFGIWSPEQLQTLPGIGPYTARALSCFAFGNTEAFLDTNIRRVYLHFFFPKRKSVSDKEIIKIAQRAIWKKNPGEWHYALFDYGATALKDKKINKRSKHYTKQSKFEGSFRFFRTKVMRFLLGQQDQTATKNRIKRLLKEAESPYTAERVLAALEKDSLVKKKRNSYSL